MVSIYRAFISQTHSGKQVGCSGCEGGKMFFQPTDTRVNAHGVVVENNQQIRLSCPSVVESLQGHTAAQRGIPHHSDMFVVVSFLSIDQGHAQGC